MKITFPMTDKCALDDWNGIAARLKIVVRDIGWLSLTFGAGVVGTALAIAAGKAINGFVPEGIINAAIDAITWGLGALIAGFCCVAVAIFIRWIFCKETHHD